MIKKLKVLFVHEVNYLTKPIFEMHELPELLASMGHEVGFLHFREFDSFTNGLVPLSERRVPGRVIPDTSLTLISGLFGSGEIIPRLLSAVVAPLTLYLALKKFKPDVLVTYAVPTFGWQAVLVCRALRIPSVYRAIDVSHKIRKSPFNGLVKRAEGLLFKLSDGVSCNNHELAKYAVSIGANPDRVHVHFPPLDLTAFSARGTLTRSELGIPAASHVIVYMGTFFYFSGLLDALEIFKDHSSEDDILLLIGGGEQDEQLRRYVARSGLAQRVLFVGFVEYSQLGEHLRLADVAVNTMIPSLVTHTALPNKVLQYLAAGLPVVTTHLRGLEKTLPSEALIRVSQAEGPREVMMTALEQRRHSASTQDSLAALEGTFGYKSTTKVFERFLVDLTMESKKNS